MVWVGVTVAVPVEVGEEVTDGSGIFVSVGGLVAVNMVDVTVGVSCGGVVFGNQYKSQVRGLSQ